MKVRACHSMNLRGRSFGEGDQKIIRTTTAAPKAQRMTWPIESYQELLAAYSDQFRSL